MQPMNLDLISCPVLKSTQNGSKIHLYRTVSLNMLEDKTGKTIGNIGIG